MYAVEEFVVSTISYLVSRSFLEENIYWQPLTEVIYSGIHIETMMVYGKLQVDFMHTEHTFW